jgi:hypothetical protein
MGIGLVVGINVVALLRKAICNYSIAAVVAVMGIEQINFMWYLKKSAGWR